MSSCRSLYASTRSLSTRPLPSSPRTLLLTLDAFGTLFHPRYPVAEQYAAAAHEYGLSRTAITPEKLQAAFKDVFRAQARRRPNYGRADVLRGLYGGPRQWWAELIQSTFARTLAAESNADGKLEEGNMTLPAGLVETLLDRFAGDEGYALYHDVAPFFARMREMKKHVTTDKWPFDRVLLGVISNSDDRVPAVLKALGLRVGDVRADQDQSSMALPGFELRRDVTTSRGSGSSPGSVLAGNPPAQVEGGPDPDLDLIITSYEAGEEKPNRLIFDVAKRQAQLLTPSHTNDDHLRHTSTETMDHWLCVHVGDDYEKDYLAAIHAGWESFLLPRAEDQRRPEARSIRSLMDLFGKLGIDDS